MEVVDDDDPWAVAVEKMLEVAAGERADRGGDLAGIDGHEGRLLLPPGERGVAGDRGDRAGPAAGDRLVDVTRQEQLADERAGVHAVLVGDDLGQGPPESIGIAAAVGDVVDPRPWDAEAPRLRLE